jgi:hypothetical protein
MIGSFPNRKCLIVINYFRVFLVNHSYDWLSSLVSQIESIREMIKERKDMLATMVSEGIKCY